MGLISGALNAMLKISACREPYVRVKQRQGFRRRREEEQTPEYSATVRVKSGPLLLKPKR